MDKNIIIVIAISISFGFLMGFFTPQQAPAIHKTRSGSFLIQTNLKGEEQIYQVLELPGNVPSFVTPRD